MQVPRQSSRLFVAFLPRAGVASHDFVFAKCGIFGPFGVKLLLIGAQNTHNFQHQKK
jgi:hypothetical protein